MKSWRAWAIFSRFAGDKCPANALVRAAIHHLSLQAGPCGASAWGFWLERRMAGRAGAKYRTAASLK
jgi:hypothetical protein